MKKLFAIGAACLLLLALAVGCAPQTVTLDPAPEPGSITVTGKVQAEYVPDLATITVGVETQAATSELARQQNTQAINDTIDAVVALGIDEADIQTSNLSMWATYNDSGNIRGYRMNMDLTITVREIDLAGQVIDVAIGSGTNSLSNVEYGLSNEAELYQQALEQAVAKAREKADALAAASGKVVSDTQTITENTRYASAVSMNADTGGASDSYNKAATRLMSGTSTLTAEVTATFLIANP